MCSRYRIIRTLHYEFEYGDTSGDTETERRGHRGLFFDENYFPPSFFLQVFQHSGRSFRKNVIRNSPGRQG